MFRYRHLERIVDDDTLLPLIHCIRTGKKARYQYNNRNHEGFPRQIRYDALYGRQYAVIHNEERRYILPITNMSKVSILPDSAEKNAAPDSFLRHAWFAARAREGSKTAVPVRVWFYIDKDENFILERLQREKRHGNLATVCEGTYLLEIKLTDPLEILPWLRSFLGYAVIEKSGKHDLFERYSEYISEMREKYGV
jgi:hypothetical protein